MRIVCSLFQYRTSVQNSRGSASLKEHLVCVRFQSFPRDLKIMLVLSNAKFFQNIPFRSRWNTSEAMYMPISKEAGFILQNFIIHYVVSDDNSSDGWNFIMD